MSLLMCNPLDIPALAGKAEDPDHVGSMQHTETTFP